MTGNDLARSITPVALPNGIIQLALRNGIRYLAICPDGDVEDIFTFHIIVI